MQVIQNQYRTPETNLAARLQEVSDLWHGDKVGHMGFARGGCSPVDLQFPLLQDLLQPLLTKNLLRKQQWQKQSIKTDRTDTSLYGACKTY